MANDGSKFENDMIAALNNKMVVTIQPNLKYLLEKIYGPLNRLRKIKCRHTDDYLKPDIIIDYLGNEKFVSLKSGTACEVHREKIESVIPYLRGLGISTRTLRTLILFQFGDGTLDGSGSKRMDSGEVFDWLEDEIAEANKELNENKDLIKTIMKRCLFQGISDASPTADYIYHGSLRDGILVSEWQIEKYVDRKKFDFISHLHIGPLLLRPHARFAGKEVTHEKYRHELTFYWPNFRADLEYIDKRFGL